MTEQGRVLVTGASGFLGSAVCKALSGKLSVRGVMRGSSIARPPEEVECVDGELSATYDWTAALANVTAVVHCAARVHVLRESAVNPLAEFRAVNVVGTMNFARQAAKAGVRRFVFISSIGVNGGETFATPYSVDDLAAPHTPYAVSKYEAEQALRELANVSSMEVVIIRPPLIYGRCAPGNFALLLKLLSSGVPVPLGAVTNNRRSFVYLGNLLDLIGVCLSHPAAGNKTFLVSDGEDLSTADLLKRMGNALGIGARLFWCPIVFLKLAGRMFGRREAVQSLCGSLVIDLGYTKQTLGWSPPFDVDAGLRLALSCCSNGDE